MASPYRLPKLPGVPSGQPLGSPRKSTLRYENGMAVVLGGDRSGAKTRRAPSADTARAPGLAAQPAHLAFDRQVLNFQAYFKQAVHERRDEQFRVRKCRIYFYLEDDSIQVVEKKMENSGMAQGTLLRRHRAPKPGARDGETFGVGDFNIGQDLSLYGRTYRLVDCDPFTRDFLVKLGVRLNDPEPFPDDPYTNVRETQRAQMQALRPYEKKEPMLKRFLEKDRQVLRFYCLWDDTASAHGQKHYMVVHYFLADDTVEIREVRKPNSGNVGPSIFLKKQRLPKSSHGLVKHPGQTTDRTVLNVFGGSMKANRHVLDSLRTGSGSDAFYEEEDFLVGNSFSVYGREMLVCDCDETTRTYMAERFGVDCSPLPQEEDVFDEIIHEPPPHTGFGSEEDSLISTQHLIPKPPPRHQAKFDHDGDTNTALRFQAALEGASGFADGRAFIISFFVSDDAVAIFERPSSGMAGGKFLKRSRMKVADGSRHLDAEDFHVGAVVEINRSVFRITSADDFTLAFMEERRFPCADVNEITARIRSLGGEEAGALQAGLRSADTSNSGSVARPTFDSVLDGALAASINGHEKLTLGRHYSSADAGGSVDYGQFLQDVGASAP